MRGGGWVQSPGRPGAAGGMKPPPSPAEAFKYGRGPRIRAALCGACGLGARCRPRERDPSGSRPWVSAVPRGMSPFPRSGCARGPGRSRLAAGLPTAPSWSPLLLGPGGNQVLRLLAGGRRSRALDLQLVRLYARSHFFPPTFRFEAKEIFPPLRKAKRPPAPPKEGILSLGPHGRLTVLGFVGD